VKTSRVVNTSFILETEKSDDCVDESEKRGEMVMINY